MEQKRFKLVMNAACVYHSRAYSTAWECFRESGMIHFVKSPGTFWTVRNQECKAKPSKGVERKTRKENRYVLSKLALA